jgi:signal transduction histidine kinase
MKLVDSMGANIYEKNIQIEISVEPDLEVEADYYMLETILRNLLSNAIKYSYKNGTIKILANGSPEKTEISVKDNGIGISNENINKLFKIDSNISTNGTNNEKGTGLGLVLVKEFVEKHQGAIKVRSNNNGTNFTFTI